MTLPNLPTGEALLDRIVLVESVIPGHSIVCEVESLYTVGPMTLYRLRSLETRQLHTMQADAIIGIMVPVVPVS